MELQGDLLDVVKEGSPKVTYDGPANPVEVECRQVFEEPPKQDNGDHQG